MLNEFDAQRLLRYTGNKVKQDRLVVACSFYSITYNQDIKTHHQNSARDSK
jgi:hypothetical protein